MNNVKVVEIKQKVKYADIIRFQIVTYCFFNNISLSDNEINCLAVLSSYKEYNLSGFCELITKKGIFKTSQTVRNFLSKAQELGLINKNGDSKKTVSISKSLNIEASGNILLNYQLLYVSQKM